MFLYLDLDLQKSGTGVEYEYWSGGGAPPSSGGWQQSPGGSWRRPKGSGGGGSKAAEEKPAGRRLTSFAPKPKDKTSVAGSGPDSKPRPKPPSDKPASPVAKPKVAPKPKSPAKDKKPEDKKPEGEKPLSNVDKLKMQSHKDLANQLHGTIQEHLDSGQIDPEKSEYLKQVQSELGKHKNLGADKELTPDHAKELRELKKLAGEHSKSPKPVNATDDPAAGDKKAEDKKAGDNASEEANKDKKSGKNLMSAFRAGSREGERLGHAAATSEGAADVGLTAVDYAATGAVVGVNKLLTSSSKEQEPEEEPTSEDSQNEDKATAKSMSWLDELNKAVPPSMSGGRVTPTEERARIQNESSYAKRPTGQGAGYAHVPDDPDVGSKWKHSDEDSVSAEVDEMLEDEEPKEKGAKTLVQEINKSLSMEIKSHKPQDLEVQFMQEVLGYSPTLVRKGVCKITGRHRQVFNEWAHERLQKSVSSLLGQF